MHVVCMKKEVNMDSRIESHKIEEKPLILLKIK